jgi:hypothetical protein
MGNRREFLQYSALTGLGIWSASNVVSAQEASPKDRAGDLADEWRRSHPDIVVYLPKGGEHHDGDNESFLVFESPNGEELLAMWTQSSVEGYGDNRTMLARSRDAVHWSKATQIAGTTPGTKELQSSWAFPVVSRRGRLYCFSTRENEHTDPRVRQACGGLGCWYSDDEGRTWLDGGEIPMPRGKYDDPEPLTPKIWLTWQIPIRDRKGRVLAGYSWGTSLAVRKRPGNRWYLGESRCMFYRFENIDDDPNPADIRITWLPDDQDGLEVEHPNTGRTHAAEPGTVLLPDGRLFTTMRTFTGHIWFSVSDDDGHTWRKPEIMRYRDGGEPVLHPLSPCPMYALRDGRYLLLFHNNPGRIGKHDQLAKNWRYNVLSHVRNPTFIAVGEFRTDAHQPIWFSGPKEFLDTDGITLPPKKTAEVGTYTSLTEWRGQRILWYPDRKHFLLGKYITDDFLADLEVPSR